MPSYRRPDARTRARRYLAGSVGAAIAATAGFTIAAHAATPASGNGSGGGSSDDTPTRGSTTRLHRGPTSDDDSSGVDGHRSRSTGSTGSANQGSSGINPGQSGTADGSSHSS